MALQRWFPPWGMTRGTVADGHEALLRLNTFPADVIVTNLNMPGLDGLGFLQGLRDSGRSPYSQNTRALRRLRLSSMMNVLPCAIDSTGHACWPL